MARHGENIRKRKDGRWEGRYSVYNIEKEKQIYCSIYGKTYEEVRKKLSIQKDLLKNSSKAVDEKSNHQNRLLQKDVLFTDMAQEWLVEVKEKRKLSTYVKYKMIFQSHLENNFQNTILSEMTEPFVNKKIPNNLSENTLKSIYCVLNQILKYVSRQYSMTIPCLKRPDYNAQKKRPVKVLTKNEQKKLVFTLYNNTDIFKMSVLLCLYTGIRLGELCALKWIDIDFGNRTFMVNRTVQRLYSEGHKTKTILTETMPKSEYSRREIPLSSAALELLIKFKNSNDYVFGGDKPMEPRTIQYHFKKILKEARLPDTNFHILRHTFATNCIERGTDVKSLSEILGHSDVQITLNRYVHPSMDTKRQYMDSLSNFYAQIYGSAG